MENPGLIYCLIFLLVISCDSGDNSVNGNNCTYGQGAIVSETRSLANFNSIDNTAVAEILLTQGPQEDVRIEAQYNILQELKTMVVNNKLVISFDHCVDIKEALKIYITIPDIRSLTLTGVGNILAQNNFDLTTIDIVLTGVGNINLKGTTESLNATLTGVGNINAFELNTDNCDVRINGVGDAEVFVNDALNIAITGRGSVFYKGNPSINSNITGSGSVVDSN